MISWKKGFGYNFCTVSQIRTNIGMRVNIIKDYNSLKGQGQWGKGQGHIQDFWKKLVFDLLMFFWSDLKQN